MRNKDSVSFRKAMTFKVRKDNTEWIALGEVFCERCEHSRVFSIAVGEEEEGFGWFGRVEFPSEEPEMRIVALNVERRKSCGSMKTTETRR